MSNFIILLKKNLLEMVRNKRIIIFSVVFVCLSIISACSARFLPELFNALLEDLDYMGMGEIVALEGSVADSYVQYISNMGEIAIFLVCIMNVGTIIKEKKSGTYTILKMNGVKDKEIVVAHFVAQSLLVAFSYLISVSIFVLLNIVLFREIMGLRGFVVLVYIFLLLLFFISLTLFVGCLFKKKSSAYWVIILSYFGLTFLKVIPRFNKFNPFNLLNISMDLMYYKSYSLEDNLISSITTFLLSIILVIVSLFIVKNRINNRKEIISENNQEGL